MKESKIVEFLENKVNEITAELRCYDTGKYSYNIDQIRYFQIKRSVIEDLICEINTLLR